MYNWLVKVRPTMAVYNKKNYSYSGLVNLGWILETNDCFIRIFDCSIRVYHMSSFCGHWLMQCI